MLFTSNMELSFVLVFFAIVVLLDLQSLPVLACQCATRPHPQQYMCEADYVIRGKVLAESYVPVGGVKTSKAPPPTSPPTTKRPPIKLPQWTDPQWRHPVLSYHGNPLSLMMADQPPLQEYKGGYPWQYLRRYTVKIEKVYKGEERIAPKSTIYAFTDTEESMCGKELKTDTRYLIAGYYSDGEIFINLCDWVVEKSRLTKDQRRGLRHTYKKYCDKCKIKSGTIYWPPESKEKDVCTYNPFLMGDDDCEGRYSSCIRLSDGTCDWMQTRGLKHCREQTGSIFT